LNSRVILLIDDSSDDRFLLKRSISKAGILNPVHEVSSGHEAIQYISGTGKFSDRIKFPSPSILLLDLQMPEGDGFEVLDWIKRKSTVHGLLVIVLTRAEEIRHINKAYALGANSFLTKPGEEKEMDGLISSFREFWLLRNRQAEIQTERGK
jgi:CheY-like chemotaxis protein